MKHIRNIEKKNGDIHRIKGKKREKSLLKFTQTMEERNERHTMSQIITMTKNTKTRTYLRPDNFT